MDDLEVMDDDGTLIVAPLSPWAYIVDALPKLRIDDDLAAALSRASGMSRGFWLNLQAQDDERVSRDDLLADWLTAEAQRLGLYDDAADRPCGDVVHIGDPAEEMARAVVSDEAAGWADRLRDDLVSVFAEHGMEAEVTVEWVDESPPHPADTEAMSAEFWAAVSAREAAPAGAVVEGEAVENRPTDGGGR